MYKESNKGSSALSRIRQDQYREKRNIQIELHSAGLPKLIHKWIRDNIVLGLRDRGQEWERGCCRPHNYSLY